LAFEVAKRNVLISKVELESKGDAIKIILWKKPLNVN
jgi:hypothetical protein